MVKLPQGQMDLFIASASDVSPKSHQDLMARNWFSLAKQKRIEPIEHHFNDSWVKVTGNPKHGLATIFDNDVLIFVIAQYMSAINHNIPTGRRFRFTGYEFFQFIGRKKFGGKGYADLWASLERLHNTFVETNIRLGDSARNHSFNWLSEIKQVVENGRHRGYEIVIPEWLYSSVVNDKLVLTLDDGYFGIKGGLERWVYLFARKTSGWQTGGWSESLHSIYLKSGSRSTFSEFKRQIGRILAKKNILGYKVEIVDGVKDDGVHFLRDHELIQITSRGRKSKGATAYRKRIE
jgi:plasmid replication initiation protein